MIDDVKIWISFHWPLMAFCIDRCDAASAAIPFIMPA